MKLSKEEKQYRKTVVFNNEIKFLQQKICDLNLTSKLTIKKLSFDFNATHYSRTVCLIFNEKVPYVMPDGKKKMLNKWASSNVIFDGSGVKRNGVIISSPFARGGAVYNGVVDEDIIKVCDMLSNEYFLWLHWTDTHVYNDIEIAKRHSIVNNTAYVQDIVFKTIQHFLYTMWSRFNIAFNGTLTKYTISELISNYNSQVSRGLIIDSPWERNGFPFNDVDSNIDITENMLANDLYG